jgi:short-subunit dehydrogenase
MKSGHFRNQVVLITGASSGIGAAMAREFASQGADLILCARRADRLAELAREINQRYQRKAVPLSCDVTRDGDLEKVVAQALKEFGKLDVVVANAGYAVGGRLEQISLDLYRQQFETNVFGVLRTIYASLEALKETKGRIVIIGSIAGHLSIPASTAYSMSKNALRGLAEGLSTELAFHDISVTHIMPGFIGTEIFYIGNDGKPTQQPEFVPPRAITMAPEKAARQIVSATFARKRERVLTFHGKATVAMKRLCPNLVRRGLARFT